MSVPDAACQRLEAGMAALAINTTPRQREQLLGYLDLLVRWNSSYNLTAVRDPLEMVTRHLLDSLALVPYLPPTAHRAIDVGTGGGLPGVPLAILRDDIDMDLLDSNGKKTRFLFQVKTALGLDNMAVRHARAEAWQPQAAYDVVLSRAFASLPDMVACCIRLCDADTRMLAMKGRVPDEELVALPETVRLLDVTPLTVPGLGEERHLVELALA